MEMVVEILNFKFEIIFSKKTESKIILSVFC